jgi:UDP-N-acetylglucosamine 2-epimerase (non-hydrolysing)
MKRQIIHLVCGARPNFMKVAPLYHALTREDWVDPLIVHTGQHYDFNMSESFFSDLRLPPPHIALAAGSGTHAEQTAQVMVAYERVLSDSPPDLIVVVGDVNSTMAATLAAAKLGIEVAHLEAGLRSRDRSMPEEINRLVTDVVADRLWAPSADAVENLLQEGIAADKIEFVGNIMIDCLELLRVKIEGVSAHEDFGLEPKGYVVVTLHRPSNVDHPGMLSKICTTLRDVSDTLPLILPLHPRTRRRLTEGGLLGMLQESGRIHLPEPLNYVRFMSLVFNSCFVITDSGGVQEETSYLGIPCLTLRENTERPITVTQGTNQLCTLDSLASKTRDIVRGPLRKQTAIERWDGRTAERIVAALRAILVPGRPSYVNV